jgi:hypothetical protein
MRACWMRHATPLGATHASLTQMPLGEAQGAGGPAAPEAPGPAVKAPLALQASGSAVKPPLAGPAAEGPRAAVVLAATRAALRAAPVPEGEGARPRAP